MRKKLNTIFNFLKKVYGEFSSDNVLKYSASLAYYTIFSITPMLVIIITLCGAVFGKEAIQGEIYGQINDLVGNEAALQIQEGIKKMYLTPSNTFANIIAVVILLVGATGIFSEIQDSLNKIWGLKIKANKTWWKLIIDRLLSFSIIISLGFTLMVSLLLNAIITSLSQKLTNLIGNTNAIILPIIENIFSLVFSTFLFALIFKVLPDAKIKWKDVIVGAIITAVLFAIGKIGIGYYIGNSSVAIVYGTAGSVVVMLVWTYYSSTILYLGAECTKVYARDYGGKITPNEYSVWIKLEEVPVDNVTLNKEVIQ